jgi:hypothetical protein
VSKKTSWPAISSHRRTCFGWSVAIATSMMWSWCATILAHQYGTFGPCFQCLASATHYGMYHKVLFVVGEINSSSMFHAQYDRTQWFIQVQAAWIHYTLRHMLCVDGIDLSLRLQNRVLCQTTRGAWSFCRGTYFALYRRWDQVLPAKTYRYTLNIRSLFQSTSNFAWWLFFHSRAT